MEGYMTSYGYIGYVDGRRMLFVSENEYDEYLNEVNNKGEHTNE